MVNWPRGRLHLVFSALRCDQVDPYRPVRTMTVSFMMNPPRTVLFVLRSFNVSFRTASLILRSFCPEFLRFIAVLLAWGPFVRGPCDALNSKRGATTACLTFPACNRRVRSDAPSPVLPVALFQDLCRPRFDTMWLFPKTSRRCEEHGLHAASHQSPRKRRYDLGPWSRPPFLSSVHHFSHSTR